MNAEKLQRCANPKLILVATNLADEAVLTCEAAFEARQGGAAILLVHVLRPSSMQATLSPKPDSLIRSSHCAAAWDALLRMAKMIEWQGATCEPVLLKGEPVEEIPGLVQQREVDRVIVATRSTRGLERLLAGSVAEALISAVDIPVAVIGPHARTNPFRGVPGGQVLVALSLHHDRADLVEFAASLSICRRSALTLVHVLEGSEHDAAEKELSRGAAHASIISLLRRVKVPLPPFSIAIREGAPYREIPEGDACHGWDLLIMGAPSPRVVPKLPGSGIVHSVIAAASCPVITLRNPAAGALAEIPDDTELRSPDREEMLMVDRNRPSG